MISPFTASLPPIAHTKIVSTRNIIIMSLLASAYNNPKLLYMQSLLPSFNFFFVTKLTTLKMVMKFLRWWYFPNFNHVLKLTISANFITLQVMSNHHWNYATFFQQIACKMIWWWRSMTNQMCVELHGYNLKFTLLVANSKCGLHIVLSYTSLTGWTWIEFHDTNCIISILNVECLSSVWLKWNDGYIAPWPI